MDPRRAPETEEDGEKTVRLLVSTRDRFVAHSILEELGGDPYVKLAIDHVRITQAEARFEIRLRGADSIVDQLVFRSRRWGAAIKENQA